MACANVLSDVYAVGVCEVANILMLLGVARQASPHEQDIVARELMRGFADTAREAGTRVTGGQTVYNPWFLVGGVASSVVPSSSVIR